jgi:hypothetical protein
LRPAPEKNIRIRLPATLATARVASSSACSGAGSGALGGTLAWACSNAYRRLSRVACGSVRLSGSILTVTVPARAAAI